MFLPLSFLLLYPLFRRAAGSPAAPRSTLVLHCSPRKLTLFCSTQTAPFASKVHPSIRGYGSYIINISLSPRSVTTDFPEIIVKTFCSLCNEEPGLQRPALCTFNRSGTPPAFCRGVLPSASVRTSEAGFLSPLRPSSPGSCRSAPTVRRPGNTPLRQHVPRVRCNRSVPSGS